MLPPLLDVDGIRARLQRVFENARALSDEGYFMRGRLFHQQRPEGLVVEAGEH